MIAKCRFPNAPADVLVLVVTVCESHSGHLLLRQSFAMGWQSRRGGGSCPVGRIVSDGTELSTGGRFWTFCQYLQLYLQLLSWVVGSGGKVVGVGTVYGGVGVVVKRSPLIHSDFTPSLQGPGQTGLPTKRKGKREKNGLRSVNVQRNLQIKRRQ